MNRSGYTDDYDDQWATIRWRGAVESALRGKRGQAFLRELLEALDALPEKRLIAGELEEDGAFCALGAVGHQRGIDMQNLDPYDCERVAGEFGIANAMACEIMWVNDEMYYANDTPEKRFERVRNWAVENLSKEDTP